MTDTFVGLRTYIGIALSLLGAFGVFQRLGVNQDQFAQFLDQVIAVVGGGVALFFNWKNHQAMSAAGITADTRQ